MAGRPERRVDGTGLGVAPDVVGAAEHRIGDGVRRSSGAVARGTGNGYRTAAVPGVTILTADAARDG